MHKTFCRSISWPFSSILKDKPSSFPASPLAKLFSSNWPNTDHIRVHCTSLSSEELLPIQKGLAVSLDLLSWMCILKKMAIIISSKSKKENQLLPRWENEAYYSKTCISNFWKQSNVSYSKFLASYYLTDKIYNLALASTNSLSPLIYYILLFISVDSNIMSSFLLLFYFNP